MSIGLIFGIAFIFFIGWVIMALISPKNLSFRERFALSYGLGIGFLTLGMFYLSLLGYSLTVKNIILFILLIFLLPSLIFRKRIILSFRKPQIKLPTLSEIFSLKNFWEKFLVLGIAGFVIFAFIIAIYWPIHTWDTITLYDFRGRFFAQICQTTKLQGDTSASLHFALALV